jgi:hypothetical protein
MLLVAAALLAIGSSVALVRSLTVSPEWGLLSLLLLVPLTELLILLAAFLSIDSDPCLAPKGELERLVEKKDRGLLPDRSPRMRGAARQARRSLPLSRTVLGTPQAATPEGDLDRLLVMKRRRAWL